MSTRTLRRFRIGDTVRFRIGMADLTGTIIEDRGPLGVGGRQIYRVQVRDWPDEGENRFEVREDTVSFPDADEPLSNREIVDYLADGGLLKMLRTNENVPHPPRLWLVRDGQGQVTLWQEDPFNRRPESNHRRGGQTAPERATYNGKVFTPKVEEVTEFLKSFGLSHSEAQQVVDVIGVAP